MSVRLPPQKGLIDRLHQNSSSRDFLSAGDWVQETLLYSLSDYLDLEADDARDQLFLIGFRLTDSQWESFLSKADVGVQHLGSILRCMGITPIIPMEPLLIQRLSPQEKVEDIATRAAMTLTGIYKNQPTWSIDVTSLYTETRKSYLYCNYITPTSFLLTLHEVLPEEYKRRVKGISWIAPYEFIIEGLRTVADRL